MRTALPLLLILRTAGTGTTFTSGLMRRNSERIQQATRAFVVGWPNCRARGRARELATKKGYGGWP
jgi:hypothetical protein